MKTTDFKKRYPKLFKKIIQFYGDDIIFDVAAAIQMYLRKEEHPKCEICNQGVVITNKFRMPVSKVRCKAHINTNNIILINQLLIQKNELYTVIAYPTKTLTRTDVITVNCTMHGNYNVNIGNYLDGMICQKCYHEARIGMSGPSRSAETKIKLSLAKLGKKVLLTDEARYKKTENQKKAWARRREDTTTYNEYIKLLSDNRKRYLKNHDYCFPSREKTGLENKFEQYLIDKKLKYILQHIIDDKKFDFYIPSLSLLVEVDGEYWHRFPSSIKNDITKHNISKKHNVQLVRISSDNFYPEIIFKSIADQNEHTKKILYNRGIDGFY